MKYIEKYPPIAVYLIASTLVIGLFLFENLFAKLGIQLTGGVKLYVLDLASILFISLIGISLVIGSKTGNIANFLEPVKRNCSAILLAVGLFFSLGRLGL